MRVRVSQWVQWDVSVYVGSSTSGCGPDWNSSTLLRPSHARLVHRLEPASYKRERTVQLCHRVHK